MSSCQRGREGCGEARVQEGCGVKAGPEQKADSLLCVPLTAATLSTQMTYDPAGIFNLYSSTRPPGGTKAARVCVL